MTKVATTATNVMNTVARVNTLRVVRLVADRVVFVTALNLTGRKMSKHRGQRGGYPLAWHYRYYRNQWLWFWKPKVKRMIGMK